MPQTVFITGTAGFIGKNTAKEASQQGYVVVGIDKIDNPLDINYQYGISHFVKSSCSIDSLDIAAERYGLPYSIIHCAGSASVPSSFNNPHGDFLANVGTTLDVLEFSRKHNNIRVVIPSSAAVYGNSQNIPLKEDEFPYPVSPYGVDKLIAEQISRSYAVNFGVPVICIRLFSVYGAGLKKQLLWDACKKASVGKFHF